jgi:hypothetical protein
MSSLCHAETNDGRVCDCEEYDEPHDSSAPSRCNECGHGKSKHKPSRQVQQGAGKKSTVLDIFAAQSQKTLQELIPAAARATDFSTARMDALKGYRVGPEESGTSKQKATGKKKAPMVGSKSQLFQLIH